ncbi:hypothetical protein HYH02_000797 [Chlamydomonas schloesseri]|uniref:isoamylase n=1 Tax=Chlamydomonas schloesseri TaxID=2026947 RepID=A0A836BD21_9CHLO|nr:hypothetical protein HYH02_000797 [Chlamydomonas schloesseri]|eukprot:KAG2454971.1 hypothetical protein HYH02_000797 [Chlamydomonas schloesseri]
MLLQAPGLAPGSTRRQAACSVAREASNVRPVTAPAVAPGRTGVSGRQTLPPARVVSVELEAPTLSTSPATVSTKKLFCEPSGQPASAAYGPALTGRPAPLGASIDADTGAINFSVFSSSADAVSLVLFTEADLNAGRATFEIPLDPYVNRTGDVWHIMLPDLRDDLLYGYRVEGLHQEADKEYPGMRHDTRRVVLDPYAVAVLNRRRWGQMGPNLPYGEEGVLGVMPTWPQAAAALPARRGATFDWEGDTPLNLPVESLVIYEAHVRGFTAHASSGVAAPGTYAGMIERLDYLKSLGVNAIELLPVFEFNELEYYSQIPGSDQYRFNFWGYSTVNYFSPMGRFSAAVGNGGPARASCDEFKQLVKECHRRGIEVILDVVFNHTAEGNERGPTISFRGLDNRVYYMLAPGGEYYNYSGCGNTLNCNQPVVRQFILDCLRHWVTEYHVDGFRFDLASILTRAHSAWHPQQYDQETGQRVAMSSGGAIVSAEGIMTDGAGVPTGYPLSDPPLVEAISEDPVLRNTKMIAEAWDCDGLNQVGAFPHYGGRWSEWNGKFRDVVRNFIKGTDGPWAGDFASAICGSPNIYANNTPHETDWWANNGGRQWKGGRGPHASINFVAAHDGFTLADMVSYNTKHNEANGENNRDGEQHNNSWNCGEEGPTAKWDVNRLRQRQMRNLTSALLLSCGVPMINMGDEYGHSKNGNNNTYCHDSELNYLRWDQVAEDPHGFNRFVRLLIHFRRATPALQRTTFVTEKDIQWHGELPNTPDWTETSRLVAFTLHDGKGGGLYVAFNTSHLPKLLQLPRWGGRVWQPLVDTSKVAPYDFLAVDGVLSAEDVAAARRQMAMWTADHTFPVLPWSCVVLQSAPEDPASTSMIKRASQRAAAPAGPSGPANPMTWATNFISGQPPTPSNAPRGGASGASPYGAAQTAYGANGNGNGGNVIGSYGSAATATTSSSAAARAASAAVAGSSRSASAPRVSPAPAAHSIHNNTNGHVAAAAKPAAGASSGGSSRSNWRAMLDEQQQAPAAAAGAGSWGMSSLASADSDNEGMTAAERAALEAAMRENEALRKRLGL